MPYTLLLPSTIPFARRVTRLHTPVAWQGDKGWKGFRKCLRWEFGFTCGICLVHEADCVPPTTTPDGLTIEHLIPRGSTNGAAHANTYVNCIWACRRCNSKRNKKPQTGPAGERLLNPVDDVWAKHFDLKADALVPKTVDATYTVETYGINEERRQESRRWRRIEITRCRQGIAEALGEIVRIDRELVASAAPESGGYLLRGRGDQRAKLDDCVLRLAHFSGVPPGAPETCRCTANRAIADAVSEQWVAYEAPAVPDPPLPRKLRFRA